MDRSEELEAVQIVCTLEYMIVRLNEEAKRLRSEKPRKPAEPQAPQEQHTKVDPIHYPEIVTPPVVLPFPKRGLIILITCFVVTILSFILMFSVPVLGTILSLLSPGGMIAGIVFLIVDAMNLSTEKKRIKEQRIEEIRNTPEYQEQCRRIDEQNKARQDELDKKIWTITIEDVISTEWLISNMKSF